MDNILPDGEKLGWGEGRKITHIKRRAARHGWTRNRSRGEDLESNSLAIRPGKRSWSEGREMDERSGRGKVRL